MRAETNLCIMKERQTKRWAESWVPVNGGARVLGGWGGVSCPGPGYLRVGYTSFSSEPSEPKSLCLTTTTWPRCTVSMRDSMGLA